MTTALGDFLLCITDGPGPGLPDKAIDAARWPPHRGAPARISVANPAPGITLAYSGDVRCATGSQRGGIGLGREPERGGSGDGAPETADGALRAWVNDRRWEPDRHRGRYVFIFWDIQERSITAVTDLFRTYPLYYADTPKGLLCASDLRLILAALDQTPPVDRDAVYHYLNFAYIPSPFSALAGVRKLEPGYCLEGRAGKVAVRRVVDAHYPEDLCGGDGGRARELRDTIVRVVGDYRPEQSSNWGTFLSGGTDSSSISGILARASAPAPVDSFSIGFAEAGYDEMSFSRIAARHFGLRPHERNVSEADSVATIPKLVQAFDEPFGNSSAIPTYLCADLAVSEGKELLIAGDGGDEIFGGNERYAKDQVFGWYHRSPAPVRLAGSLLARALSRADTHAANRVRNMIHRGNLPNPDRFYSDDAFASDCFDELLTPEFRQGVSREGSLQIQRDIFAHADAHSELNRLMYLDLMLTIAESDVVKVVRTAKLAGVDIAFPYLDRSLVDYTGRLSVHFKVNRLKKRYLFKLAMADLLPVEIIKKRKQGFGLPVAVWLRRGGLFRDMVNDVVLSKRARERGYFNPDFIAGLVSTHEAGSWDYSSEIFRLLMLELWHREYLET